MSHHDSSAVSVPDFNDLQLRQEQLPASSEALVVDVTPKSTTAVGT